MNRVMNKCKAPKIPPILSHNKFIINCKAKANAFSFQCKPLINGSVLPNFTLLTTSKFDNFIISSDEIVALIRNSNKGKANGDEIVALIRNSNKGKANGDEIVALIRNSNKGKANGPDDASAHMLILCDETIAIPLKLIFEQVLATGIFPNIWKSAILTLLHKKGDKQLVKNYRPISLLPIYGNIFEKIIYNQLYLFVTTNNLITKNQSGFRSGDSTTNQLLTLVNEIRESFDNRNSLEVRSVFLDISKAFDKVWHEGLIFKLKQNGVGGNVVNLLGN